METVLIAGGTGLIGKHLSSFLQDKGFSIRLLSRNKTKNPIFPTYIWNISKGFIEKDALTNVDYIINLAGANIGSKRWTISRKNEILSNRVESTKLLFEEVQRNNNQLKAYITASAIGYYGAISSEKIFNENDKHATDFLGRVCNNWEKTSLIFEEKKIRTVQIRTGAYNAVAPSHITNKEFTEILAKQLKKRVWLPKIPNIVLKIILGEMANLIVYGSRVSSEKISKMSFKFKHTQLSESIASLNTN